ncbi:hypothetical protein GCM10009122_28760 [Fulvivirga kasyanovii]|uniref:DUF4290 domain-containing protein n=1 Tax=Fulvivirga kasyanovii TaxID=396812 RepID=A0ABW9RN38_9BACT|nr:DUF4290 domain-containing protein [Fulvivirga kasyanovii]MTI25411.1 DUF4290 domain-containing protein [Fulvivirga kasyanovii]
MEYNTSQPPLILREYGRNVQKLVEYIKTIQDKSKRTESAETLIELMKQVTPTVKETPETSQKLWDDLYIMSNFDIDIEAPYPMPEKEVLNKKPKRLDYSKHDVKFKHYGKNIELLIKEAIKKEDPAEREEAIIYIGKLMKSFYSSWNKEVIDDSVILENIKTISKGELTIDLDKVKEDNLFEKLYSNKRRNARPASGKSNDRKSSNRNRRKRN